VTINLLGCPPWSAGHESSQIRTHDSYTTPRDAPARTTHTKRGLPIVKAIAKALIPKHYWTHLSWHRDRFGLRSALSAWAEMLKRQRGLGSGSRGRRKA
jgi:hypothetical protein